VQTLGMAACLVIAIVTKVTRPSPPPPGHVRAHSLPLPPCQAPQSGSSEQVALPSPRTPTPNPLTRSQLTLWLLVAAAVVCGLSTAVMESGASSQQLARKHPVTRAPGAFGFSGWLPPRYTQGVMTVPRAPRVTA
jgi:hypothetical protein